MVAVPGSIHDKYQFFISNLEPTSKPEELVEVFFRMTQPLNVSAVALIAMGHHADARSAAGRVRTPTILACQGPEAFWSDYMDLCRTRAVT